MNACLCAIALAAAVGAAPECLFHGALPEGTPTFRVAYAGGGEDWAAVRVGSDWAAAVADITGARGRVELYYDTPWNPREPLMELPSRAQFSYEAPAIRRERLRAGWDKAGYTFVEGAAGCLPVPRAELELAERARAMTAALSAQTDLHDGQASAEGAEHSPAAPAPGPGWLRLWGPHLLVVAGGGIALAAAIRFLLLAD